MKMIRKFMNKRGFSQILVLLIIIVLTAFVVANYVVGDGTNGVVPNMRTNGDAAETQMDGLNTKMTTATTP